MKIVVLNLREVEGFCDGPFFCRLFFCQFSYLFKNLFSSSWDEGFIFPFSRETCTCRLSIYSRWRFVADQILWFAYNLMMWIHWTPQVGREVPATVWKQMDIRQAASAGLANESWRAHKSWRGVSKNQLSCVYSSYGQVWNTTSALTSAKCVAGFFFNKLPVDAGLETGGIVEEERVSVGYFKHRFFHNCVVV